MSEPIEPSPTNIDPAPVVGRPRWPIAVGLLFILIDFTLQGHDVLPDLLGAVILLWGLSALAAPPQMELKIKLLAGGLILGQVLARADAAAWISGALGASLADRAAGPLDAVLPAVNFVLVALTPFCEGLLVVLVMIRLAGAARRNGRAELGRLALGTTFLGAVLWLAIWLLVLVAGVPRGSGLVVALTVAFLICAAAEVAVAFMCLKSLSPLPSEEPAMALIVATVVALAGWLAGYALRAHGDELVAQHREGAYADPGPHALWLTRRRPDIRVDHAFWSLSRSTRAKLERLYARLVALRPSEPGLVANAARIAAIANDHAAAEERYQQLERLRPDDPTPTRALGGLLLSRARWATGSAASTLGREALIHLERARGMTSSQDPSLSRSLTRDAAEAALLAGNYPSLRRLAGELLQMSPDRSAISVNPSFEGHQYLGLVALHEGKLEEAKTALLRAGRSAGASDSSFVPGLPLAQALLGRGERAIVLTFLRDLAGARRGIAERVESLQAALNRGEAPDLEKFLRTSYRNTAPLADVPARLEVRGVINKDAVLRTVRELQLEVDACYTAELARTPRLAGRVVLSLVIDSTGSVDDPVVRGSSLANARVEKCIVDVVRRGRFPKPGAGRAIVSLPFDFKPPA